ncbi:MAG: hypothetical protein PHO78_08740 [Methanomicrobium sp.]|nr:hypothetical protein [Methanomicrobium sp.]
MDEKLLKALLMLLPVVLIILAVIAPFSASGWDTAQALFGGDPLAVVDSFTQAGESAGADYFTPQEFWLSEDKTAVVLRGSMKNPYDSGITVTDLVYRAVIGGENADMTLKEHAFIAESGSGEIILTGPLTDKQIRALSYGEKVSYPQNPLIKMTIELYGIKIKTGGE